MYPVEGACLAAHDSLSVLDIARAAGEQFVQDEVLGARERDGCVSHHDPNGTFDGRVLVGCAREDEIDPRAGRPIREGQDEGLADELVRIARQRREAGLAAGRG